MRPALRSAGGHTPDETTRRSVAVADFVLTSEWHLTAPIQPVWRLIANVDAWPRWWRYVRRVELLQPGDDLGIGAIRRIVWTSALAYGFELEVTTSAVEPPWLVTGASRGDLQGVGQWELASIPVGTRVRYLWDVELRREWMRHLSPLIGPLFARNHHHVMRIGAQGMAEALRAELIDYRAVAARDRDARSRA